MKFLKDFFYDKNDILVALLILVLAGGIIFWRVEVIMAYPSTIVAESNASDTAEYTAANAGEDSEASDREDDESDASESSDQEDGEEDTSQSSSSIMEDGVLTQDVTVTVPSGSATNAVNALVSAGLFDSYDDFVTVCESSGYSSENIMAATYLFRAGMTKADIAGRVTS